MGSNFDLNPVAGGTSDPQARIHQKLAELDARLMAQERRRDLLVTPFDASATPGSAVPGQASFNYDWAGGRLWIIWGGTVSIAPSGGYALVRMRVNANAQISATGGGEESVTGTSAQPLGLVVDEVPASHLVLGTNTLYFWVNLPNSIYSAHTASGLIIEWPQQ